jgi:hypothetical protein
MGKGNAMSESNEPTPQPAIADAAGGSSAAKNSSADDLTESSSFAIEGTSPTQRRGPWLSSWAAIKYVLDLGKRNDIQFRASDRITTYLLMGAGSCWIALMMCPIAIVPLAVACDILFVAAVVYYIANRLGIITTLTPRTAALITELICGIGMLMILTVMNFNALFAFIESVSKPGGLH